jgi:hypothetical protein
MGRGWCCAVFGLLLLASRPAFAQSGFDVYVETSRPEMLGTKFGERADLAKTLAKTARELLQRKLPYWHFDEPQPSAYLRVLFQFGADPFRLVLEVKRSTADPSRDAGWDWQLFEGRRPDSLPRGGDAWVKALQDALVPLLEKHQDGIRTTLRRYPISRGFELMVPAHATDVFGVLPIDWATAQFGDPVHQVFRIQPDSGPQGPAVGRMLAEGTGNSGSYGRGPQKLTGVQIQLCGPRPTPAELEKLRTLHAGAVYWETDASCSRRGPEAP